MFYLYLLLALALLAGVLFVAPLRCKVWVTLAAVTAAAAAVAVPAIGVLAGAPAETLVHIEGPLFGCEQIAIDRLSALFLLIIAVSGIATVLYSRGYLQNYLAEKSSAHISLHYFSLTVLVLSMMLVVMSSGGFSFLLAWELMTIASFLLILFDAQRAEVLRAALAYLIMMHIGFVFLVAGFVGIYAACGSADFADLPACFAA